MARIGCSTTKGAERSRHNHQGFHLHKAPPKRRTDLELPQASTEAPLLATVLIASVDFLDRR